MKYKATVSGTYESEFFIEAGNYHEARRRARSIAEKQGVHIVPEIRIECIEDRVVEYEIAVDATYTRTVRIRMHSSTPKEELEKMVVAAAEAALDELPGEIGPKGEWRLDWDNVQSGGIYGDYHEADNTDTMKGVIR